MAAVQLVLAPVATAAWCAGPLDPAGCCCGPEHEAEPAPEETCCAEEEPAPPAPPEPEPEEENAGASCGCSVVPDRQPVPPPAGAERAAEVPPAAPAGIERRVEPAEPSGPPAARARTTPWAGPSLSLLYRVLRI